MGVGLVLRSGAGSGLELRVLKCCSNRARTIACCSANTAPTLNLDQGHLSAAGACFDPASLLAALRLQLHCLILRGPRTYKSLSCAMLCSRGSSTLLQKLCTGADGSSACSGPRFRARANTLHIGLVTTPRHGPICAGPSPASSILGSLASPWLVRTGHPAA